MKKLTMIILGACAVFSAAFAVETFNIWQPLQGATYKIFSGDSVAYSEDPTANDRKLSIVVKGQAAKEIFDSVGPDERESCSGAKGDRERSRGAIQCTYTARNANDSTKGYRCWVGVDLMSGQGIPTVPC